MWRSVDRRIVLPYKVTVTWWTCDSVFFVRQCSLDLEAVEPRFKTLFDFYFLLSGTTSIKCVYSLIGTRS